MVKTNGRLLSGNFISEVFVFTLALFVAATVPLAGTAVLLFIPLPVIYYCRKNGMITGAALALISLAFFFLVAGSMNMEGIFPLLCLLTLSGIVMAEAMRRNYSIEKTVGISVAAVFFSGLLFLIYIGALSGETPWTTLSRYITAKINYSINFYEQLKISTEQMDLIKENLPEIAAFITWISPALVAVGLIFMVWVNLLAGKILFMKSNLPYPDFGDLSRWKAPEKLVWYLIASGGILLMPYDSLGMLGWNMLIVILFIYLLAGMAIISFFLKKNKLPRGLKYMVYFLVFAQQIVTMLVVALGLFDLWADFRKLNKPMEDSVA